ncbi:MAG: hypothetical protein KDK26_16010 [Roseivivax sp.]|nr:hypothetical protein [Roseivivax sp.]
MSPTGAAPSGPAAPDYRQVLTTAALVAGLWSLSSVGYYALSGAIGAHVGYNDAPVLFAAYYAAWSALAALLMRTPLGLLAAQPPRSLALGGLALAAAMLAYVVLALPLLPQTAWTRDNTPVEFFWATQWYFLPKTVEIAFQQILIAALVTSIAGLGVPMWKIALTVALLFGGFHLTLGLAYPNPFYVARYTAAAALFGALVPWLLLRVAGGFLITFALHWAYYALDILLIHLAFAVPAAM